MLDGVLVADDTEAMFAALTALGIVVRVDAEASTAVIEGVSGRVPAAAEPSTSLDVRQSGTTGRFVLPILGTGQGRYRLDGHEQLRARPFGDLVTALRQLGMDCDRDELPISVSAPSLVGGSVSVPGSVSSQFLSGLLLAAPCATSPVDISVAGDLVSRPYVTLTIDTMDSFGAAVDHTPDLSHFRIEPLGYTAANVAIEPDASAASYFFGAAAMTGGRVRVEGLSRSTVQGDIAFVEVLEQMGATVDWGSDSVTVTGPPAGALRGVDVDLTDISDTAQTLAVVATAASAPSRLTGIGFIRRKETDRIGAVATELTARGISVVEEEDGLIVHPGTPTPGRVATYDDHRMAMSFALLGLRHPGIEIDNPGCVAKTYPRYFEDLDGLRRR